MAARALQGSYVRDNYPGKVPLLPQHEGSEKWGEAHGKAELPVPRLQQAVPERVPLQGRRPRSREPDPSDAGAKQRRAGHRERAAGEQAVRAQHPLQAWGGGKRPAQPQVLSLCADR